MPAVPWKSGASAPRKAQRRHGLQPRWSRFGPTTRLLRNSWTDPPLSNLWRGGGLAVLNRRPSFALSGFGLHQPAGGPVIVENLRVAAPVHRGVELALHFILGEMLVQNVVKKLVSYGVVRLPFQNTVDLLQDRYVLQCRLPEQNFARRNVGVGEHHSLPRQL